MTTAKWKIIPVTENILPVSHTTCMRNISCHMMKYTHVTRKTSCDRKNTSCGKRSIISVNEGFFPFSFPFLVTENLFPVPGIKRTPCVTIHFHVKEIRFLLDIFVTRNCLPVKRIIFPLTARTND